MISKMIAIGAVLLMGACADQQTDELAAAFKDLEQNHLEIRLGNMPELGEAQCNRNMYAGLRGDIRGSTNIHLNFTASIDGTSPQMFERELVLETTSQADLIAGQVPLFPRPMQSSCSKVHVTILSMSCSDAADTDVQSCPMNVRWQWLQGFKMFEIPKAS